MIQEHEAAPYYFRYINLIPSENIVETLQTQLDAMLSFLNGVTEEQSLYRYSPDKWTIRQVLNHINDTERVFLHRAFWFSRGFKDSLPGFEQDDCVKSAGADDVSWKNLVDEFRGVRLSTLSFFQNLPEAAWSRSGIASDNPVTVRALAYIVAGHVAHHRGVLEEKYLSSL
jgi:uncharacterized damage-inducible protein DinB